MDANGSRFWSFASEKDWRITSSPGADLHYCKKRQLLRLKDEGPLPAISETENVAIRIAKLPSRVKDVMGVEAFWDEMTHAILASSSTRETVILHKPIPELTPADLTLGADDILYAAFSNGVLLLDRRGRWSEPKTVTHPSFVSHRLAPAPEGGAWALDRDQGLIGRIVGMPLRDGTFVEKNSGVFFPEETNPNPPRIIPLPATKLRAGTTGKAIACSNAGQVAVLAWAAGEPAIVYTLENGSLVARFKTANLNYPVSLRWIGETQVALLTIDLDKLSKQAFVYELDQYSEENRAVPLRRPNGKYFPLINPSDAGFLNVQSDPPDYALGTGGFLPLRAISSVSYAREGHVILGPIDSQKFDTIWHRLYAECVLPEHCDVTIKLFAENNPSANEQLNSGNWHPHAFGAQTVPSIPKAAWLDGPSELPNNPGLLDCPRIANRAGLFSVLIQRSGSAVRRLTGRYLWVKIECRGNSHLTPQIAGLRIYSDRFSYRDRYLPALYHETAYGEAANASGRSTRYDFLDRFLGLIEEPLTHIEGKVAHADLLTNPASTPASALPWLSRWIGLNLDETATSSSDRQKMLAAPHTARMHGTLGGLHANLELATGGVFISGGRIDPNSDIPRPGEIALAEVADYVTKALVLAVSAPGTGSEPAVLVGGGVTGGEIVVVEGFRMRRTYATILGADLVEENDPLTLGLSASGNSIVGDTLVLGDEHRREFLALFADDLNLESSDREAIAAFFEKLAWRVTILVHDGVIPQDLARLQRVAEAASPAHLEVTVKRAAYPFLVGVASLVGVDTYLANKPAPQSVDIGRSSIGVSDFLTGDGFLDGSHRYAVEERPVAVINGPAAVLAGRPFLLSAARSRAPQGGHIASYVWTWT